MPPMQLRGLIIMSLANVELCFSSNIIKKILKTHQTFSLLKPFFGFIFPELKEHLKNASQREGQAPLRGSIEEGVLLVKLITFLIFICATVVENSLILNFDSFFW